ncbi:glycosyltransferase family 39 protein [Pleurocapsales cyanobacterium LEGE 06147]|nr:glycosyltransferase family 39 protein [Pleurocapsales cyanobacterium LEGE 06147]
MTLAFFLGSIILILCNLRFYLLKQGFFQSSWFLSSIFTFLLLAIVSLVLVRVGNYSPWLITIIFFCISAFIYLISSRKIANKELKSKNKTNTKSDLLQTLLLFAVLFFFGVIYAAYPTYYMLGVRDPGLYLIFSGYIAKTGGLNLDLPFLGQLYKQYGEVIQLGYPGIYSAFVRGLSEDPGTLIPQFMQLFPAFAANFSAFWGIEGVVRANALISVMGLWSFFMVGRYLMPFWPAWLATIALGINPAVVWNVRITLTEMLALTILFFGFYLLVIAKERNSIGWGILAGLILGVGVLNRIDSAFNVLVIVGFAIYSGIVARDKKSQKIALFSVLGYLVTSTVGFLDGYLWSYPYIYDLWILGSLKGLIFINYFSIILSLAILLIPYPKLQKAKLTSHNLFVFALAATIAITLWLLFAYLIRPFLFDSFDARALRELGWYVTPLSFILFAIGSSLVILQPKERNKWLPMLFLAGVTVFIYTWKPSITPDHIWASRRWVPQVIPSLILFSTYAIFYLYVLASSVKYKKLLRLTTLGIATAIFLIYLSSAVSFARPYLFKAMLGDYLNAYKELVEQLPSQQIYLTSNPEIASVLTYIYSKETVIVNNIDPLLLQNDGYFDDFYIILDGLFKNPGKRQIEGYHEICGPFLQKVEKIKPNKVYDRCYDISIISPVENKNSGKSFTIDLPASSEYFGTQIAKRDIEQGILETQGNKGFVQFGPHIDLPAGKYSVSWYGTFSEVSSEGNYGFVDVTSDKGSTSIKQKPLILGEKTLGLQGTVAKISFSLDKPVKDLEYRLYVNSDIKLTLHRIVLEKLYNDSNKY